MAEIPTLPAIVCIVEGEGEEQALPILVRRIAMELGLSGAIDVFVAKRTSGDGLKRAGGIEAAVEEAARSSDPGDAILVLLDADDSCPAQDAPALLGRARSARSDRLIGVVMAKREYEAWFLAAAESLAGKRGLPPTLQPPPHPEEIRGAKEWLRGHLPRGRRYRETADQPACTALFDMGIARVNSPSFDKCYREIAHLISVLTELS